jgi:hypothetical protein
MLDLERSEPVNVAPGQWIIANEGGTFRVSRIGPETKVANGHGQRYRSPRTVRALLNGALYAAFGARGRQGERQPISLTRLVYILAGSYHHFQTPPRLAHAAGTFKRLNRNDIATFLELKAREETGHDRLALRDLAALGLPAERIVQTLRPPVSIRLLELLDSYSRRSYPMAVLGYAYCMERLAIFHGEKDIKAYQALCPSGVNVTRCLRVHSGVGADDEHVDELVEFVTTLDKNDVALIATATYQTASTMVQALLGDAATTDADITARLQHDGVALPFAA